MTFYSHRKSEDYQPLKFPILWIGQMRDRLPLSPLGAYLISVTPEEGLKREGAFYGGGSLKN